MASEAKESATETPAAPSGAESLTDENGRNNEWILCTACDEKILQPGVATLVEKELFLHAMMVVRGAAPEDAGGDTLSRQWSVASQMDFENVAVTKPIGAGAGAAGGAVPHPSVRSGEGYRYLACATCDRGPVGMYFYERRPPEFYVTHDRIKYAAPASTSPAVASPQIEAFVSAMQANSSSSGAESDPPTADGA